ncbi:MAG: putative toxin-antitoxin system toxin component, PIN family [bacterium]|nr:putative toxin-antitoxin system toxin component, PIN family [bacterium]
MLAAVIDTNLLISSMINPYGFPARLINLLRRGRFQIVYCREMVEEFIAVTERAKFSKKYGITKKEVNGLLKILHGRGKEIRISGNLRLCRDTKDNMFLETSILGKTKYVVSRDDDIKRDLVLIDELSRHGVEIVTVSQFLKILG